MLVKERFRCRCYVCHGVVELPDVASSDLWATWTLLGAPYGVFLTYGVRFLSKVYQTGHKWDKSRTFQITVQFTKCTEIWSEKKVPDLSNFGRNWPTLEPNVRPLSWRLVPWARLFRLQGSICYIWCVGLSPPCSLWFTATLATCNFILDLL